MTPVRALLPALALAALAASAAPAVAGLKLCNTSAVERLAAIGYSDGDRWVSEGWWRIAPGACATVVRGDLRQRWYYVHTQDEVPFAGEGYRFCVTREAFTIEGDTGCGERGYDSASFARIDTGPDARDFTVELGEYPAAAAGQYGEPITITGLARGCTDYDGTRGCGLAAEGWLYVVMDDGRTPTALVDRLAGLAEGRAATVSGDLVAEGDVSVVITARSVEPAAVGPFDAAVGRLVGLWRSRDDERSTVRYGADRAYYDYYDGDLVASGRYDILEACPAGGPPDAGPVLVVNLDGDPEAYCYGLDGPDDDRLDLVYLARGNLLSYERIGE